MELTVFPGRKWQKAACVFVCVFCFNGMSFKSFVSGFSKALVNFVGLGITRSTVDVVTGQIDSSEEFASWRFVVILVVGVFLAVIRRVTIFPVG